MSASTSIARPAAGVLPVVLALAAGLGVLVVLFLPEARAAVRVWTDSTAYGHCYLVVPIALYLAWDRRDEVRGMRPVPTPMLALLGLPLPFAWFAAERLGIMEGRQLVALSFVELLFLVTLGWRLFFAMLGPLLYLYFLVPFGAFITPVLQTFTAGFIEVGLTILGIPHYSNEMLIETSAGTFFVAEACAGLRFLIASIAFGVFYALLNYRSQGRRAGFIAASIIVPVVANGFRALGIVVLGSVLGSAEAAAADHIIYGWVFFSIVMLLLVAGGLPFRELPAPPRAASAIEPSSGPMRAWAVLPALLLAAVAPGAAMALDRRAAPPVLVGRLPIVAPEGCTAEPGAVEPGREVTRLRCADRSWTVTVQAVPPQGTGSAVAEARNRLIGSLDPEETTTTALRGAPAEAGAWQVMVSRHPSAVVGVAAWVHGQPAPGGMRQRIEQARDSLVGNTIPPVLIAIVTRSEARTTDREIEGAVRELDSIVAAQAGLNAKVAALSGLR